MTENILINTENKNLKNIVSNIEISENNLIKKSKKKDKTESEIKRKKLPSLNLMKTKTIRLIKEKRSELLKDIKKNKQNYFYIIENI
jgi:hypothetical protein